METQSKFNPETSAQFIKEQFEKSVVPSISDYIRIPNLSRAYDQDWQTNGLLLKAATHIKSWVEGLNIVGLKSEIIIE
jgi:hypothetical protein